MTKAIKNNSKKGFTLVELVVVIAILAILAAIAIPVVNSIINTASRNGALSNAQTIELAVKECQADIATRNDEVYAGQTINGTTIPKASTNSTTAIKVSDVALVKGITDAFDTVTYNGSDFQPFWDNVTDKCVYLCVTSADSKKVAVNSELSSDDLTKAYNGYSTTRCIALTTKDAKTGKLSPASTKVGEL